MELIFVAAAAVVVTLLLANAGLLAAEARRYEPVRSRRLGPVSIELRRAAIVLGHDNGRGGIALAQAHEVRLRLTRVFGLPVWRRMVGIELPAQVAGMLSSLTARDFDAEFGPAFRESEFARLDRSLTSQWRIGWTRY